ncbi:TPA: CpaF family protein [Candidatus Ventrenecus stercoripullorum]|nr:CpaF family protein [Candidatus Ventrenecus stercoripullorum]
MRKTSLVEAFNIERKEPKFNEVTDYDIFPDKKLLDELRTRIVENLIDKEVPQDKLLNQFINDEIDKTIEGYDLTNLERSHLYNLIDNEINGYGPLTELLEDKNVTEIMVNSPKEIYIEIDGQLIKDESVSFINDEHIIRTIERMIGPMGRTIDATNPMVDSRLKDGSRINAIIPPLSTKGPVITIRKFKRSLTTADDMIRIGSMTPYMATFLEAAVRGKCNIIVCGGTGSGKTTLLNILSGFIPDNERIITIEDAAELKLEKEHVISLETRVTNYDNEGEVTIRDLVINALRMRPDRIIVGEVRGKEAFDMLQAMNTGHEGSLTTLHANGPKDALNRLETMVLMSGLDIPIKAIREYIVSAIDLVVNIDRMSDGKRKVTSISELENFEGDEIKLKEIFAFHQKGLTPNGEVDGEYILYNDTIPAVYKKISTKGINDIDFMFPIKKK